MSDAASQKRLALVQEAVAAFQAGDADKADRLFRKAAADAGGKNGDPRIPYNYAIFLRRIGRAKDALYWLDRCLRMAPDHRNAAIERGLALVDLGESETALSVLAAYSEDHDALRGIALATFRLGRWQETADAVTGLGARPASADRLLRIRALAELGQLDMAEAEAASLQRDVPELAADIQKALTRRAKGRMSLIEPQSPV